jgi:hypothetical protein
MRTCAYKDCIKESKRLERLSVAFRQSFRQQLVEEITKTKPLYFLDTRKYQQQQQHQLWQLPLKLNL